MGPSTFLAWRSNLNEGSVTQICAEHRKQGSHDCGLRHVPNALGALGVCWDIHQKASPQLSVPSANPQSPHRRELTDPILQTGKVRPTTPELPRGCHREAGLVVLPYPLPPDGGGSLPMPIHRTRGSRGPWLTRLTIQGAPKPHPSNILTSFHDQNIVETDSHILPAGHLCPLANHSTEGTSRKKASTAHFHGQALWSHCSFSLRAGLPG